MEIDERPETVRRLRKRLFGLGFVDELGPIYAIYTIWFADNGITASQISTVFLLWAVIAIVFEVPSGALADLVDRRTLLAVAFGLRAIGIAIWVIEPSYTGVIAGAALWSIHESLASGAWEANVHDQLTAVGQERTYAGTMARLEQFGAIGIVTGATIATGWIAAGGTIVQLGWITVALHAVSIWLVLHLADVRWIARLDTPDDELDGEAGWADVLRDGLRFARHSAVARRLITIGSIVGGLYVLDDYVPLIAQERGASDALVPVFVAVIFIGLIVGDEIVVRRPEMSGRLVGLGLVVGGGAMTIAMLTTSMWPLLLVGIGYAAQQIAYLIGDARLQEHLPPKQRATVTSVRSFFEGIIAMFAIGIVTLVSATDVSVAALAGIAGVLCATGLLAARWIPEPREVRTSTPVR